MAMERDMKNVGTHIPITAVFLSCFAAGIVLCTPVQTAAAVAVGGNVIVARPAGVVVPSGLVELREADRGRTIVLRRGQRIMVSLPANPSTGYQWEIAGLNRNILRPEGHSFRRSSRAIGSAGADQFYFRASRAGRTELRLYYLRPFSGGIGPANVWRANIIVDNWLY